MSEDSNSEGSIRSIQRAKVSLRDFDDVDPNEEPREDQYDDIDDLEKQIDFDDVDEVYLDEKIRNELLFAVQGLGSTKKMNDLDFYMKGPHCEDSLKDILKLCDKFGEKHPVVNLELGKWEVLQKDLVQLLISQVQDKKLTFYLLILMVHLTTYPPEGTERRNELLEYLQNYKITFTSNSNVIQTINLHLADCLDVAEEERTEASMQMIEFIVSLYKNLLKIPDPTGLLAHKKPIQPQFLVALHQQNSFDAFVFIVQRSSDKLWNKIGINILEIFYHIFSPFEPIWLFQSTEQDKSLIQKIREREKRDREWRLSEMSTRHARFDCNVKVVRAFAGGAKIIHNPFKSDVDVEPLPNRMKIRKTRLPKAKITSIFPNSHDKQLISSVVEEDEFRQNGSLKLIMRDYAVDFLEHVYDRLIESLYEDIYKEANNIDDDTKIYYFVILGFGLEVFRHHFHFKKELNKNMQMSGHPINDEYSIANVGAALQLTVLDLLQSTIVRHVNKQTKTNFSPRLTHSALYAYLQLLCCVKEIRISVNEISRKSAQLILQKVFTQDISRMLSCEFELYMPGIHDIRFGTTLVEFMGVFFDLMEEYSKGKVLKIQTNRKLVKKKKNIEKILEKKRLRREKQKERRKKKKQKEKEKAKRKQEKERAKLTKKDKKKKKKKKNHHKLDLGQEEERPFEEQENMMIEEQEQIYQIPDETVDEQGMIVLTKKRSQDENDAEKSQNNKGEEEEEEEHPEIPATIGTEYTVGSTLQSDINPTIENIGPTLETMPTLMPNTLDFGNEEILHKGVQENEPKAGEYLESTLVPEEICPTLVMEIEDNEEGQQKQNNLNIDDRENTNGDTATIAHPTMEEETAKINNNEEGLIYDLEEEKAKDNVSEDNTDDVGEEEEEAKETDDEIENNNESEDEDKDDELNFEDGSEDAEVEDEEEEEEIIEEEIIDDFNNGPQFQERIVNFASELAYLANYRVLDTLLNMITADKLETNNQRINSAITSFIKRIVYVLKSEWLFFQIDYLLIFQDILNSKNPKLRIDNPELFEMIHLIVRKFFILLKKNKFLSVECLFRFQDKNAKNQILNNYEEEKIEVSDNEDAEIGNNLDFVIGNKTSLWDEKSDMILIQNYEDYKDLEDCEAQLCLLFNKLNMNDFSIKDIKKRIKVLKLHKGTNVAQEIYNERYRDTEKPTIEQSLKEAFENIECTSLTKNVLVEFLISILDQYLNFKNYIGESVENLQNIDMAIVPTQRKDFDILGFSYINAVFRSMDFKEPKQGECYWRVPSYLTTSDIEIMMEKIREFLPQSSNTNRRNALAELPIIEENELEDPMALMERVEEIKYDKTFDNENKENEIECE